MTVRAGTHVGAYEIVALLGAGGMGEVYRARDARLERDVAIKILPEVWLTDPDRRARLEREARVLASLNHPHIGAIYGVEESGGVPALVLELVEGQTLAERITPVTGLPLAEALSFAREIADALDAAHEKGIIHRDLKPANIKITPDGIVKVLDFGLATYQAGAPGQHDVTPGPKGATQARTMMIADTSPGMILGTAGYMSPEQARGKPIDKRTDIWAYGCVLYQMLTGRTPFGGETGSDMVAAILERQPDWTSLPPATPVRVRRLLERCLAKDPRLRLRDIGDARLELDEALDSPATAPADGADRKNGWTAVRWVFVPIVTAAVAGFVGWSLKPGLSSATPISGLTARLVIAPPPGEALAVDVTALAMSLDGRHVAYVAGQGGHRRIFLRGLDEFESTPIPGTEGGDNPFFSPDGQWVGFFANGKMKKVMRRGGMPVTSKLGERRHDCVLANLRGEYLARLSVRRRAHGRDDVD